jgi:nucleoid-associated protein YgaU
MTDRLKIFKMLLPAEFVLFDYNPETIKVTREQARGGATRGASASGSSPMAGTTAGSLGAIFHGTDPMTITIQKARLVGPECKLMCDNLLNWLSPASGLLGAATSAIMSAIGLTSSKPPDLVVQWGPPTVGFMITAQMTRVDINYMRVTTDGIPVLAECNLTLKESPSPLSLTNPTSGGRPGRNRHVVLADETLMSIATQTFGNPNTWRAIAEVNRIDDPSAVRPGDVIYLPAPDELRELAEAAR